MVTEIKASIPSISGSKFAIVVSKYNDNITDNLRQGAIDCLIENGIAESSIDVIWVPGGWELSLAAKQIACQKKHDGIICLGAVIKGETSHDEHINRFVSMSLGQISLDENLPIAFGLLTCNNLEQAIQRSGGNVGNKGIECAMAALEMVSLKKQIAGLA